MNVNDYLILSWTLWYDDIIKVPKINKLDNCNVCMVAYMLDPTRNILSKRENKERKGIMLSS